MTSTFNGCTDLEEIPLFNTSNVTNMTTTFNGCSTLTIVPLLDTSNVITMVSTFQGCSTLVDVPLFNTVKVTSMNQLFYLCANIVKLPTFNTSNVTIFVGTFANMTSLTEVPPIDTAKGLNMTSMFVSCTNLRRFIAPLNTVAFSQSGSQFTQTCPALIEIPAMDLSKVITTLNMAGCSSLVSNKAYGMRVATDISAGRMTKDAIETLMYNLGTPLSAMGLTITNNPGADALVASTLVAGQAAGSTTLTVASSAAYAVGEYVTNAVAFAATAVTFQTGTDTVTKTAHGLVDGTMLSFATRVTTTALTIYTLYYVINATTDTFQLSMTRTGGSVITLNANGTGTMRYEVYITGKPTATTVTLSAPTTSTTTATAMTARYLNTNIATLKLWSITG
jgi:surface protein